MASIHEVIGELNNVMNIIENVQAQITGAGESLQSARGLTAGIGQDVESATVSAILGKMNMGQEDIEALVSDMSSINDGIQTYITLLASS